MLRLLFLLILIVGNSCTNESEKSSASTVSVQKLDDYFSSLAQNGFSGSVLVLKNDSILLKKGYGKANSEKGYDITSTTVFNIASVSKHFTAACILKLYADKKIQLNDKIGQYIKSPYPKNIHDITIHQLLTHTAGIVDYYIPANSILSKEEYLSKVFEIQETEISDNTFSYSNTGYELLSILIEEVSGMSFERYVRLNFFQPLGMRHTGFLGDNLWAEKDIAIGTGGALKENANLGIYSYGNKGSGNIVTNIEDLYKWELAINNNQLFNKEISALWFNEHVVAEVDGLYYGYGWRMNETKRKTKLLWHTGWEDAFNVIYYRLVDEGITIIFLSNYVIGLDPILKVVFPPLKASIPEIIILEDSIPNQEYRSTSMSINGNFTGKYYLDKNNFLDIGFHESDDCYILRPYGQKAVNLLFDYTNAEMLKMDTVFRKISLASQALVQRKNIADFVIKMGPFDPYEFYDQKDNWVIKILDQNSKKYGPLKDVLVSGAAHSSKSKLNRNSTELKFIYQDTALMYTYVNYDDERYFVEGSTNIYDLHLCPTSEQNSLLLNDIAQRFGKKKFSFDESGLVLSISSLENNEKQHGERMIAILNKKQF